MDLALPGELMAFHGGLTGFVDRELIPPQRKFGAGGYARAAGRIVASVETAISAAKEGGLSLPDISEKSEWAGPGARGMPLFRETAGRPLAKSAIMGDDGRSRRFG